MVVFDFDDTLVETRQQILSHLSQVFPTASRSRIEAALEELPMPLPKLHSALKRNEITDSDYGSFHQLYYSSPLPTPNLFPWVSATLSVAADSGCKVAICTNEPASRVKEVLGQHGILQHFDGIFSASDAGIEKASREALHRLARIADASPFKALIVGDSKQDRALADATESLFWHRDEIASMTPAEFREKLIRAFPELQPLTDADHQQYRALRAEGLQLLSANEVGFNRTLAFVTAAWTALLALAANLATRSTLEVPLAIFVIPLIVPIASLSRHLIYEKRVANISSFIGCTYGLHLPSERNWETQIGEFARRKPIDLGAVFSHTWLYRYSIRLWIWCVLFFWCRASLHMEPILERLVERIAIDNAPFFLEDDFLRVLDLVGTGIFIFALALSAFRVSRREIPFAKMKETLNGYWSSVGSHPG